MVDLSFDKVSLMVIGDSMLDVYISGKVSRISPEAPVPIVEKKGILNCLGGAANTAANIASLGCATLLVSPISTSHTEDYSIFTSLLSQKNIALLQPLYGKEFPKVTKKTRIVGNDHQLVRLDEDFIFEWEEKYIDAFMRKLVFHAHEGVLLCDYGKGFLSQDFCQKIIQECVKSKIKVFVDPKDGDWGKYSGAYCVKPNLFELSKQASRSLGFRGEIIRYGRKLMDQFNFSSMLITMGEKGMLLLQKEEPVEAFYEALPVEVFDVSGAGDTAIAVLAAHCAVGLPLLSAAHFANKAAAAVVTKKGTQVVKLSDIKDV